MYCGKKILGIIPARGGSKGIPRKNIRELFGKPLIAWTILEAQKSKYIDRCIISTEDEEIYIIAKAYGGDVPFLRPAELAQDDSASIDVVLHALDQLPGYDYVILLQPTSPLRSAGDMDAAISCCVKEGADSCVSVTEAEQSPYWMYTLNERREMQPLLEIPKDKFYQRQKLPKVYRLNGAVYVNRIDRLRLARLFVEEDTIGYVMPKNRSCDIDTLQDFQFVEMLMKGHGASHNDALT